MLPFSLLDVIGESAKELANDMLQTKMRAPIRAKQLIIEQLSLTMRSGLKSDSCPCFFCVEDQHDAKIMCEVFDLLTNSLVKLSQ